MREISGSSNTFLSDCAPPETAESACMGTRTTVVSGCCAASVEPPVWAWKQDPPGGSCDAQLPPS